MLDPIKVSVVMPGVSTDGSLEATGIPAMLVTAFLSQRGIQVEKTTDFTILFLFSLGVTKGKYGTLINALLKFKDAYDENLPVAQMLYNSEDECPEEYKNIGLKTLADSMFSFLKESRFMQVQAQAFTTLPEPAMTPADAYIRLVHNEIETVSVDNLYGRILATGIVPYPPGIPMLMPNMPGGNQARISAICKYCSNGIGNSRVLAMIFMVWRMTRRLITSSVSNCLINVLAFIM